MNWKHVNYSVSMGLILTAVSFALFKHGGELFLWPGIFVEVLVNGLILLVIPSENFFGLPSGAYLVCNAAFYSLFIFLMLLAKKRA